jgi:hypothetical protein
MAELASEVTLNSDAADDKIIEATWGDLYHLRDGSLYESISFEDWNEVLQFLSPSRHPYNFGFLTVPTQSERTALVVREKIGSVLPLNLTGSPSSSKLVDFENNWGECDNNIISLETPSHSMPYFYLSIAEKGWERRIRNRSWQGGRAVLVYAVDEHCFDFLGQFRLGNYQNNLPAILGRETMKDKSPSLALVGAILLSYIASVIGQAKRFDAQIRRVEAALGSRSISSLSDLLHELNTTSHEIRASGLEEKMSFISITTPRVEKSMWHLDDPTWKRQLQDAIKGMEPWRPSKLRERIAELRLHAADVRDELRQKREEDRQKREDARQEREERRASKEEKLLEESIRIAKETKRDSRTMRGIAWVTIAFLPATFVTSFFGMNFFNGIAGKVPFDGASRNVWLFFAIAVPISGFVLFTFYFWDEYERKKDEKKVDGEKNMAMNRDLD